jgi:predicted DNA-binding transcriptional regulator AlpA
MTRSEALAGAAAIKKHAEIQDIAPTTEPPRPRRMLNQAQVLEIVPISPVTLWRLERAGRFPRGTFISPNKKVWFEDEVVAWQNEVNGRRRGWRTRREREAAGAAAEATE